MKVQVRR